MLSYLHGFHAGNHADVLKHLVLVHCLAHMARKDKPYWYVDTHAGAADYALDDARALKNAEFETGIARLWGRDDLPPAVEDYVACVRAVNPDGALRRYPGSPRIALDLLRPDDRARLFELHSTEIGVLQANLADAGRRVLVQRGDGFAGLRSVLPPPPRRGLVLIDPAYEDKADYARTRDTLADALSRFATGTYVVWYPQVQRRESRDLPEGLANVAGKAWLHASLTVKAPEPGGHGLHGSGVFLVNPPWTLEATLRQCLPFLARVLGQDGQARFGLQAA